MDSRGILVRLLAKKRGILLFSKKSIPALERVLPPIQWVKPAVVRAARGWGAK